MRHCPDAGLAVATQKMGHVTQLWEIYNNEQVDWEILRIRPLEKMMTLMTDVVCEVEDADYEDPSKRRELFGSLINTVRSVFVERRFNRAEPEI